MSHPAAMSDDELIAACEMEFLRRSGPGGQHRNKVETAVRLKHADTGLVAEAGERRSQAENRRVALRRLRMRLALSVRVPVTEDREVADVWRSRCAHGRIAISATHADFPTCLAECFDWLQSFDFDVKSAAGQLQVTTSQLTGFLRKEPAALRALNEERQTRGLRRLK